MAGKQRYWKEKDGRFYARIAVPAQLRPYIVGKKSELIEPLGGDRGVAKRLHHAAVARLQQQIAEAQRQANAANTSTAKVLFPLSPAQIAADHYRQRLHLDDQMRNDPR